jgi:hypothetical protein
MKLLESEQQRVERPVQVGPPFYAAPVSPFPHQFLRWPPPLLAHIAKLGIKQVQPQFRLSLSARDDRQPTPSMSCCEISGETGTPKYARPLPAHEDREPPESD